MSKMLKNTTLLMWGGSIYFFIEVIYKSLFHNGNGIHWSMYIVGMCAFYAMGIINEHILTEDMPLWIQCLISTFIILLLEFVSGLIINVWLKLNVWHYDHFHIMHQVCLSFSFIWYFLSAFGIWLDDKLRELIFKEKKIEYKIF